MALDYRLAVIGETSPLELVERLGFTRDDFERTAGVVRRIDR